MNESSRDTSSVFGKAAGTAMGIGIGVGAGAAGISAAAYTGKKLGGVAIKNAKETHAAAKNVQRDLGERLVNNMDDMGKGAKSGINRILKTFSKVK